jgi:hypothetical protein
MYAGLTLVSWEVSVFSGAAIDALVVTIALGDEALSVLARIT